MKENLEYYKHECKAHHNWKFKLLRNKFGWAGEGRFWALNGEIGDSAHCKLDMKDKNKMNTIAGEIGLTIPEFKEFLNYLIKDCRLLKREGDYITNDTLKGTLSEVMKDRESARERKLRRSQEKKESSGELFNSSGVATNKEEKSKVNQSKVNQWVSEIILAFPKMNNEKFLKAYSEWVEFRAKFKKPIKTELAVRKQLTFLSEQPDPIAVINKSIESEWTGLFPIKHNGKNTAIKSDNKTGSGEQSLRDKNLKSAISHVQERSNKQ